jgi:hypothetical protein
MFFRFFKQPNKKAGPKVVLKDSSNVSLNVTDQDDRSPS